MPHGELIVAAFAMVALALVARRGMGSWFAPGAFFALVWTGHVLLSLIDLDFNPWAGAVWWIAFTCAVVAIGSKLGMTIGDSTLSDRAAGAARRLIFYYPEHMIVVSTIGATVYTVLSLFIGVDISIPGERPPMLFQLLLPFHFAGPLLAGAIFSSKSLTGWRRLLTLLPLLPPAALSLLWTGRTAIVAPIISWGAAYIAVQILLRRGKLPVFTVRTLTAIAVVGVSFFTLAIVLDTFRMVRGEASGVQEQVGAYVDVLSLEQISARWDRSHAGFVGHVYSFSYYFIDAWRYPPSPHGGTIVFAAPLDLLGLGGERYPYEEFELAKDVYSNIFTMFRNPIDDFGLWGSLVWWFGLSVVQGWAFSAVGRGRAVPIVLLTWFYVDVSLIGGFFFRYNSIILSYVLAFAGMCFFARVEHDTGAVDANGRPERSPSRGTAGASR
jgi:hypothetical protein